MQRALVSTVIACGLLVAASTGGARPAQAFESTAAGRVWDADLTTLVTASFLLDLTFSTVNLQQAIRGSRLPRAYGAAELLLTVPQIISFAPAVSETWGSGDRRDTWFLVLAAWSAVLAGHGAWTLMQPSPVEPPGDRPSRSARQPRVPWAVSPAILATGGPHARPAASLLLHGRF
jgi:hypothetical protein